MKYTKCIHDYLASSRETWCSFAERAGVSRAALYKFLRGENAPRIDTVEKLLRAAGFSLVVIPATTHHRNRREREGQPRGREAQGG